MKKVLSAVLAGAMVLGMGFATFADVIDPNANSVDLTDIPGYASGYSLYSGITDGVVTGNGPYTYDWQDQYAQDKPKLEIDLWTYMFDGIASDVTTGYRYYYIDVNALGSKGIINDSDVTTIAGNNNQSGKITALSNALNTYFDAKGNNYTVADLDLDNVSNISTLEAIMKRYQRLGVISSNAVSVSAGSGQTAGTAPGTFLDVDDMDAAGMANGGNRIYFFTQGATESGVVRVQNILGLSSTTDSNRRLTASEIRNSKIALKTSVRGDSKLIKKLELDRSAGKIILELVDEFVSVKEADLEMTVYLTFDGKYDTDDHLTILATLKNYEIEVYANYDYVDISDGRILITEEFNPAISVYIGNGVTIDTKLFNGKKYYGITTRDPDETDNTVFRQYPDVDNVVTLKTIGFSNTGDVVRFDTDSYGYYVYDKDMNYLGKADEKLPFSAKYYLANKKLETETTAEPEPVEEDDDDDVPAPVVSNPSTGGDAAAPNVNLNPGTGR